MIEGGVSYVVRGHHARRSGETHRGGHACRHRHLHTRNVRTPVSIYTPARAYVSMKSSARTVNGAPLPRIAVGAAGTGVVATGFCSAWNRGLRECALHARDSTRFVCARGRTGGKAGTAGLVATGGAPVADLTTTTAGRFGAPAAAATGTAGSDSMTSGLWPGRASIPGLSWIDAWGHGEVRTHADRKRQEIARITSA